MHHANVRCEQIHSAKADPNDEKMKVRYKCTTVMSVEGCMAVIYREKCLDQLLSNPIAPFFAEFSLTDTRKVTCP